MERPPRENEASRRYFDGDHDGPADLGPPPGKPTSGLLACGVIVIVLASIYILLQCCGLGSMGMMLAFKGSPMMNQPGMEINRQMMDLYRDPVFLVCTLPPMVVNLILYLLALIAGVGIVKLKPWTRRLALFFSGAIVFSWVVGILIQQLILNPRTMEVLDGTAMGGFQSNSTFMAFGTVIGIVFGFVCMISPLPILLLIVLHTKSVRAQFERAAKAREAGLVP